LCVGGRLAYTGRAGPDAWPARLSLSASFTIDKSDRGMTYGKGKIEEAVGLSVSVNAKK
jgi:hypothetical protein